KQNWRDEVPDGVWQGLKDIFSNGQHALFGDHNAEMIQALRHEVIGPLGYSLIDLAAKSANGGAQYPESLVEVAKQAFLQRAARGNKQVEEHWHRESSQKRTAQIRTRLESALSRADLDTLVRECLGISVAPKSLSPSKQSSLDDGVQ